MTLSDMELIDYLQKVSAIPECLDNSDVYRDSWYREDSAGIFKDAGLKLIAKGFTVDEAIAILTDLFLAVSLEYGA